MEQVSAGMTVDNTIGVRVRQIGEDIIDITCTIYTKLVSKESLCRGNPASSQGWEIYFNTSCTDPQGEG